MAADAWIDVESLGAAVGEQPSRPLHCSAYTSETSVTSATYGGGSTKAPQNPLLRADGVLQGTSLDDVEASACTGMMVGCAW